MKEQPRSEQGSVIHTIQRYSQRAEAGLTCARQKTVMAMAWRQQKRRG
jgi:hypothetical protein